MLWRGQVMLGVEQSDIDEATDYDRFVTVDGEETDDEGEGEKK